MISFARQNLFDGNIILLHTHTCMQCTRYDNDNNNKTTTTIYKVARGGKKKSFFYFTLLSSSPNVCAKGFTGELLFCFFLRTAVKRRRVKTIVFSAAGAQQRP